MAEARKRKACGRRERGGGAIRGGSEVRAFVSAAGGHAISTSGTRESTIRTRRPDCDVILEAKANSVYQLNGVF